MLSLQIRTYFAEFGDMMMCQLKKHKDGSSRGYAFVRFKTMETQKKVHMCQFFFFL